ncbi:MAG: ABC transporter ATP-binding protein, partial [Clostridia bacterium]|nr:ABC transporter ATP-binding protein [Clostridia bacterium]
ERYPHEFSGGQRQRICIARALSVNPKLVVCDEPVSALDVSVHAQILNLLDEIQKKSGLTYLFISHNLAVVKSICDHMAVMYLGKVMECGSTDEIYKNTLHPYTKALLSAVLDIDVDNRRERVVLEGDIPSPINPPPGCRFCGRCPNATEICSTLEPQLVEISPNHKVACHLYPECTPKV